MAKKVLVAVNLKIPTPWAVFYGIQLAARLKASLVLMAVFPGGVKKKSKTSLALEAELPEEQRLWLEQVVEQCQQEEVSLEIFLSSGPFFEEVAQFLASHRGIQFLVVGVPRDSPVTEREGSDAALKRIHHVFPGEILLVREQGKITSLADLPLPPKERKS